MSPSVSKRSARALVDAIEATVGTHNHALRVAVAQLKQGLADAKRKSLKRVPAKKEKLAKHLAKKEETQAIREAVFKRAGGKCECGCGGVPFTPYAPGELDHFRGRGKEKQTVENCWALAPLHHRAKTDGYPSRASWLQAFVEHCNRHGYSNEGIRAANELASIRLMESARLRVVAEEVATAEVAE